MAANKPPRGKKFFTVDEANRLLPLVRSIVRDITELARDLGERRERLSRVQTTQQRIMTEAYREELQQAEGDCERDEDRLLEYEEELLKLGVELKDYRMGLIDFPCWKDGREVYLCWRLGEPEVAHWHEVDAGFAGRRQLARDTSKA
jgi:hypothetical protein